MFLSGLNILTITSTAFDKSVGAKSIITLQALVVSMDANQIPDGAVRGLVLEAPPGTIGGNSENTTSYMFNKSLIKKTNLELRQFMKAEKRPIPFLDQELLANLPIETEVASSKEDPDR